MTIEATKKHLFEAATLIGDSPSEDGTWKVRLISEGKGSSGTYTAEFLESNHSALDDLLSFTNHPTGWDGPQERDFTMIAGELAGKTWIEKDERGLTAVYGNYRPDPDHKGKLERYKSKLGVSIYIEGSGFLNESGEFIVDWFNPEDPYASLDVVIAPGARGRFEESMKKMYAQRGAENKPPTASVVGNEKTKGLSLVEMKEIGDKLLALEALVKTLADVKAVEAQAEADSSAVEAEVDKRVSAISASLEAIESARAELLPGQIKSLTESARKGQDVTEDIASAKAVVAEAKTVLVVEPGVQETGRLGESAGVEYTLRGFGGDK